MILVGFGQLVWTSACLLQKPLLRAIINIESLPSPLSKHFRVLKTPSLPLEKHISRAMGNALKIPIVAAGKVAREGKGKAAVTGGLTHISG